MCSYSKRAYGPRRIVRHATVNKASHFLIVKYTCPHATIQINFKLELSVHFFKICMMAKGYHEMLSSQCHSVVSFHNKATPSMQYVLLLRKC